MIQMKQRELVELEQVADQVLQQQETHLQRQQKLEVTMKWKMEKRKEIQMMRWEMDQLARLLGNLRRLINEALSSERFEDASELQPAVMATLSACSRNTGLDMELVTTGRNCFQRLYRRARNRGSEGLAATFRLYADDFQRLLV